MSDPRLHPLVELDFRQVREMLSPVAGGAEPREIARAEGGLVNTVYRVTLDRGEAAYALRVYAGGRRAFETERRLLSDLGTRIPVPEVLFADASGARCSRPYLVYRWLEGMSLNECRKRSTPESFLSLAGPLGSLLARIANVSIPDGLDDARRVGRLPAIRLATRLERAEDQLRAGRARERLGGPSADSLIDCFKRSAPVLRELEHARVLVHGDFGGRNVLVKATAGGAWEISGVIDWEEAAVGSVLWDVGSLFRYPRRYSKEFRALFEHGYRSAGRTLPTGWRLAARMLDATRLVAILNEDAELPGVFAECRELVAALVADRRDARA